MARLWKAAGVLLGALALTVGLSSAALAAGGDSTPGATVMALNSGWGHGASSMRMILVAHSQKSTVANPSCRPQDANIRCWGELVLNVPAFGGMTLSGLQVHRVAVGDTACSGGDEGGNCGDEMAAALRSGIAYPVDIQVNGLSKIIRPGRSGLPAGTQVQVKVSIADNGPGQYRDTADVQVNRYVSGATKPLIYDSGPQTIQQVLLHSDSG